MPVLRHGMLEGGEPRDFVMAWVSVPDLAVSRSEQRYEPVSRVPTGQWSATSASTGTSSAELEFDSDGLVVCYPEPGRAARPVACVPMQAAKRYHLTTFGCQMNEHDSERMKGMLESLGYAEAPERDDADLILFNTCSIREKADNRLVGHLGEAKRLKAEDPSRVVGVGGCWSQSMKDEVFEQFPFVDVAFGPGPGPQAGRVPHQRQPHRPGLLRVRGLHRAPADAPRARVPGLGADLGRAATARAPTASCPRRAAARCRGPPPSSWPRSSASPPTACARSRCSART